MKLTVNAKTHTSDAIRLAMGSSLEREAIDRVRDMRFAQGRLSKVAVTTLHVTSTEDVIWIPGMHSGV